MHTHTRILLALRQTALLGLAASLSFVVVNASFITRPPCLFFFFLCLWRNVVLFGLSCSQDVTASLFKWLECRKVIKPVLKELLSHTTHRANKDNRLTKNAPHLDEELAFSGTKTKLLCIVHLIGPLEFS